MINYEDFIKNNLGKPVEREDPSNPDQCMDWAFAYLDDVLGINRSTIRHEFARQVWTGATDDTRKYFDLIPNTPTGVPQKGDLVVFGTEVGRAGHICLASGNVDGTKTFQSTDENWNGHSYVEYVWHSYGGVQGVLGWLRPRVQSSTVQVDSKKFEELVTKSSAYDEVVKLGYPTLDLLKKRLAQPVADPKHEQVLKQFKDLANSF